MVANQLPLSTHLLKNWAIAQGMKAAMTRFSE